MHSPKNRGCKRNRIGSGEVKGWLKVNPIREWRIPKHSQEIGDLSDIITVKKYINEKESWEYKRLEGEYQCWKSCKKANEETTEKGFEKSTDFKFQKRVFEIIETKKKWYNYKMKIVEDKDAIDILLSKTDQEVFGENKNEAPIKKENRGYKILEKKSKKWKEVTPLGSEITEKYTWYGELAEWYQKRIRKRHGLGYYVPNLFDAVRGTHSNVQYSREELEKCEKVIYKVIKVEGEYDEYTYTWIRPMKQ